MREVDYKMRSILSGLDSEDILHIEKGVLYLVVIAMILLFSAEIYGDIRSSESQEIRIQYQNLSNDYKELRDRNQELRDRVKVLEAEKENISQNLRGEKDETIKYRERLTQFEQIPVNPVIPGISYATYGMSDQRDSASQVAVQHPEIELVTPSGTGSMSPMLSSNSLVIATESFDPGTLSPGDIVTYTTEDNRSIMHRIHRVDEKGEGICYVTKGDSRPYTEGVCVEPEQIKNRALGVLFTQKASHKYCEEEIEPSVVSQRCP